MARWKRRKLKRRFSGWIKGQFSMCGGERDRGMGRADGCVERIFTSVNSRVIALIAAVNNSKRLVSEFSFRGEQIITTAIG